MKVMVFILSMVLFVGGLVLMGYAFSINDIGQTHFNVVMFAGGLLASALAVFIPMHVLNWADRA